MANQIRAPYNFVPINHEVYLPSWSRQISMDIPFSDSEDGVMEVELANTTPLFVRNGMGASRSSTGLRDTYSVHLMLPDGSKRYFLPGSSLKGMLRGVMEILSFARLKDDAYNDDFFGFREFDGKDASLQKAYLAQMNNGICCGWLRYDSNTDEYLLDDCGAFDKDTCRIRIDELRTECPAYAQVADNGALEKNEYLRYPVVRGRRLVCTGKMQGKLHEYLFGEVEETDVPVSREVITKLKTVYKPSDYKDTLYRTLDGGERIAVFFKKNEQGAVSVIGLTRNFRYPYKVRLSDCVRQTAAGDAPDLPDCIFGYVGKTDALKGRVIVGNAFADRTVGDEELDCKRGVLGQPSASYFPLYLHQKEGGNRYVTYNDEGAELAGRKRYRVHAASALTDMPEGNGNENVMSELRLLPAGLTFRFRIAVHNLRPAETGALLSALTFHGTKQAHHNIGQGKSFGYGTLVLKSLRMDGFRQEVSAYLKAFELEMSRFYEAHHPGRLWADSECVRKLVAIAMEHGDKEELTLMNLTEYGDFRKNDHYSTLKEAPAEMPARVDADVLLKAKADVIERRLDALTPSEQCEDADVCKECAEVLDKVLADYAALVHDNRNTPLFDARMAEIRLLKNAYMQRRIVLLNELIAPQKAESFEAHIAGACKVGTLAGKLKKWTADNGALTDDEVETLRRHVTQRLPHDKAFKKEKKCWEPFSVEKAKGWSMLYAYVATDVLQRWYGEMTKAGA